MCMFSSLALYTRPYLIFFSIFVSLAFLFKKQFKTLLISSSFFIIFSIPGLILFYLWGGSLFMGTGDQKINFIYEYHHPRFILKNLIFFVSIFFFYLIPFKILEIKSVLKSIDFKFFVKFILVFLILFFLLYIGQLDFLTKTKLGGGFFYKLNNLIFENNYIFFILISSLGLVSILPHLVFSLKNKILFFSLLSIYCLPKFIYQEYFEPLVIILFLSLIELNKKQIKIIYQKNTLKIIFFYYFLYLGSSYIYRYFLYI